VPSRVHGRAICVVVGEIVSMTFIEQPLSFRSGYADTEDVMDVDDPKEF